MSSVQSASNRSRNQNRKKANEDASYIGPAPPNSAGVKRQAGVLEGESSRAKRKKVEPAPVVHNKLPESENRISMVDFAKMPSPFIYRYLATFDLIPPIRPLPNSADEPPPPYSLGPNYQPPSRAPSPVAVTTPANRPRRDQNSKRRSSRLSEEETLFQRTPVLADVHDLHLVLAGLAEKHFREMAPINGREEVDTLAAFIFAVERFKGGKPR
ncbi:hypothetical protein BT96DRAFT_67253 [Gymnopus androsaceus JB14]|uniref:Histone deacetylase complex subunit SAP30 Sin3 binding domain-containing protein n=1 Tax=Gymnopus androsaceus JB14 TaxID=1447944 RepID=A0A6A4HLD6_9AGAR|nr:hypothetical protein BT96DRAFT_67253 [Gymnopus androsaceus JB14]